ncbi:putative histidine phosphatase family protein [Paratrimastix pyriformis]|uniref:Histidine phosphatase family protein n=1 Tax=Paratrimastix pyriformis TaxID=342808 RepID=A0ABQ8UXN0_9EUKA|nr:putative histidine phosphatase family protein [Paratrimastix pyriformis]
MEVTLLRHGETLANRLRIAQGQSDVALSALGHAQAACLADWLEKGQFDEIFCSDLQRTRETLAHLISRHPRLPVTLDPRLREKSSGEFEGKPTHTADKMAVGAGVGLRAYRPPGGESWEDVTQRAMHFLYSELVPRAQRAAPPRRVLVVSHGGWCREFLHCVDRLGRDPAPASLPDLSPPLPIGPSPPVLAGALEQECRQYPAMVAPPLTTPTTLPPSLYHHLASSTYQITDPPPPRSTFPESPSPTVVIHPPNLSKSLGNCSLTTFFMRPMHAHPHKVQAAFQMFNSTAHLTPDRVQAYLDRLAPPPPPRMIPSERNASDCARCLCRATLPQKGLSGRRPPSPGTRFQFHPPFLSLSKHKTTDVHREDLIRWTRDAGIFLSMPLYSILIELKGE